MPYPLGHGAMRTFNAQAGLERSICLRGLVSSCGQKRHHECPRKAASVQSWHAFISWTSHDLVCVARLAMTPAGLEAAIPGSVGRCLIHWATGPLQQHRPVADSLFATPCVLHVRHPGGMLTPPMHTFHRPAAPHRGTLTCTVAILAQGTHWAVAVMQAFLYTPRMARLAHTYTIHIS